MRRTRVLVAAVALIGFEWSQYKGKKMEEADLISKEATYVKKPKRK